MQLEMEGQFFEMSRSSPLSYNTRIELFMVLKNVNLSYTISCGELKTSPTIKNQQITVYWKPPGALQWFVYYESEIVNGKSNMQFTSGPLFDFELADAPSIGLKFEMRQHVVNKREATSGTPAKLEDVMVVWSTMHTTLERIILAGAKGVDLCLTLDFGFPDSHPITKQCRRRFPGILFLRGEIHHPESMGVNLQFGLQYESKPTSDYFLEFLKLNQDNVFELSFPYTLVYRSELEEVLAVNPTQNGKKIFFSEARLSNGDMDRVLKIDIFKKETFERKGFALTTLRSILKEQTEILKVDRIDKFYPYRKKEMRVVVKLCNKIPIQPIEYYLHHGWKVVPVFAVDFSRSNWNEQLHKRVLHDGATVHSKHGKSPYEEALELSSEAISSISGGHNVFYGFGCPTSNFMNAFRPGSQHVANSLKNYQDALCVSLMSELGISQDRSPKDASSSQSSSSSASSPQQFNEGTLLSPLFNDLVTLITARKDALEYYTIIILTDGQFCDSSRYIPILRELTILPVSLIFVGIGLGDLQLLMDLEQAWKMPCHKNMRKFVHLIHFRSKSHWDSALLYDNYRSNPKEIFNKEILNTVQEDAVEYFKRYFGDVAKSN